MQVSQKKAWIGLEGMEFYAYHGVYEKERQTGGNYIVDVWVYTNTEDAQLNDNLAGTLNYEQIYHIVQETMQTPVNLIEHLAGKIAHQLKEIVSADDKIKIKIKKLQPPLNGNVYASVVELEL